jgi:hypothetical protein
MVSAEKIFCVINESILGRIIEFMEEFDDYTKDFSGKQNLLQKFMNNIFNTF